VKSLAPGFLERLPISHRVISTMRTIGEYRGKEDLFKRQTPQVLEALRQAAVIESTESSNRIEGIVAPRDRIAALVAEKTAPRNRSEQEIAGYRDVLNTIHGNFAHMEPKPNLVLQLHRDLYRFLPAEGGRWKIADNQVTETRSDGTRVVRFQPVPAWATSAAMDGLHAGFRDAWGAEEIDRLIVSAAYVLDFLCIHPFLDGNGRMARLLSLLLLHRAGYEVGRYVSLERVIEESRETYYDTLFRSSQGWHEGSHDLRPWLEYFLGVLIAAYREFERRAGEISAPRGAKTQMVLEAVRRLPREFRLRELEERSPGVTRDMVRVVLNSLKQDGRIVCEGRGRGAVWRKVGTTWES
jgi:Fic family protein